MTHVKKAGNLFFIKRVPKLHIPRQWHKPADEEEYNKVLNKEGFLVPQYWQKANMESYPVIKQDLSDLDEHLLPAFFEFNQKAKHYQNRFYLYQWVFMLGAFITTLLGALTTYAYTWTGDMAIMTYGFGIATAVVSAVTAFFNVLNDQMSPQNRWTKSRRLAEELRKNYYLYLAHVKPFDTRDRVQILREMVVQVRRKEVRDVG